MWYFKRNSVESEKENKYEKSYKSRREKYPKSTHCGVRFPNATMCGRRYQKPKCVTFVLNLTELKFYHSAILQNNVWCEIPKATICYVWYQT